MKIQIATDYNARMPVQAILQKYGIGRATLYKVLRDITKAVPVVSGVVVRGEVEHEEH